MPQDVTAQSQPLGHAEEELNPGTRAPLVTGGGGFAGAHLIQQLAHAGRTPAAPARSELDLLDAEAVRRGVGQARPDAVFHLAAFSSPRRSWEHPDEALLTNIQMTLNVLEAVRTQAPGAALVLVGSGQAYGNAGLLPVTEEAPLEPLSPYAVSKAACDMLGRQYAVAHAMHVVRLRPFNHAGPGQADEYVLGSLASQVAAAELRGASEAVLRTGDTASARDFTDVRDVVRAYVLAAEAEAGAYNVCSGRRTTIGELIDLLDAEAHVPVRHEVDPQRLRTHDAGGICGSHGRLTAATGWKPEIPLEQTVRDTLAWWRRRLR